MQNQQIPQTRAAARALRAARSTEKRRRGLATFSMTLLALIGLVVPASIANAATDAPDDPTTVETVEPSEPTSTQSPVDADVPGEPTPDVTATDEPTTAPEDSSEETEPATDEVTAEQRTEDVTWTTLDSEVAPATVPSPNSNQAVISVKVGGDRQADGTVTALQGVTLRLYRGTNSTSGTGTDGSKPDAYWFLNIEQGKLGAPYTQSWATCTSDANGDCSFIIPIGGSNGVAENTRFWVVQESAPTNWYLNPKLRVGSFSGLPEMTWEYRFHTDTKLERGKTYLSTAPMGWSGSLQAQNPDVGFMRNRPDSPAETWYNGNVTRTTGTWAVSRVNPVMPATCDLRVAVIADTSGSLGETGMAAVKTSLDGMVDAFQGTGTQMALFNFSASSPSTRAWSDSTKTASINYPTLLPVTTAAQGDVFKAQYKWWEAGGGTNWDAGFGEAAKATQKYDLAVLVTDGNPTMFVDPDGSSAYNAIQDVDGGVFAANQLKAKGTHIIALGVGPEMTPASLNNLRAVSGTAAGSDYMTVSTFPELNAKLKEIATQNCDSSIVVQKKIVPYGGTIADATNAPAGWEFAATGSGTSPTVLAPTTKTTDSSGKVEFGLKFTAPPLTGNVTIRETQQAGYSLVQVGGKNAECRNASTGAPVTVTNQPSAMNPGLTVNVGTNVRVECTMYNQEPPTTLVVKKDLPNGRELAADQFRLQLKTAAGATVSEVTTSGSASGVQPAQVGPSAVTVGSTYTVAEIAGNGTTVLDDYLTSLACVIDGGAPVTVTPSALNRDGTIVIPTAATMKNITCTFTNTPKPRGSVAWQKVQNTGTDSAPNYVTLPGATFKIVGPAPATTEIIVEDCKGSKPSDCNYDVDKDYRHGFYKVPGLKWGSYQLIEVTPPPGFVLDETPRPFTIGQTSPAQLDWDLGRILNRQTTVPTIPLTGGASEDAFMIGAAGFGGAVFLVLLAQYIRSRRTKPATA